MIGIFLNLIKNLKSLSLYLVCVPISITWDQLFTTNIKRAYRYFEFGNWNRNDSERIEHKIKSIPLQVI